MPDETPDPRLSRSTQELLRDLELVGRLRDIRDTERLKQQLAPKWWEGLARLVLFAAALGLLISLVQHPLFESDAYARLILGCFVALVLALTLCIEFIMLRLHLLRRTHQITLRRIIDLHRRLLEVERATGLGEATDPAAAAPAKSGDEAAAHNEKVDGPGG